MKKIIAYFTDAEKAGNAAFDLAENFPYCTEITVKNEISKEFSLFDTSIRSTFLGAFLGITLGFIISLFPNEGILSVISPVTGLISGSVIGAISGSMLDLLSYEALPICTSITVEVPKMRSGIISHLLREKGAVKTFSVGKKE